MYKVRKIKFENHPILKNLELNFCDMNGKVVETVIFAGENGTGKSTILNELYKVASHTVNIPMEVEFEDDDNSIFKIKYYFKEINNKKYIYAKDLNGIEYYVGSDDFKNKYKFNGIFSDVDINFNANNLSSVTSLNLDISKTSYRSSNDLPTRMNQLLIDVQSLDDSEIARQVKSNPDVPYKNISVNERMTRFTNAFNKMFENLSYSHVENVDSHKSIVFEKYGNPVSIENLSSGEKQIVYRGAFLLKDKEAMNGAFVFIDEPEISMHPNWQSKVMNFYKEIFTDNNGKQTSQIFSVTHSPFIIHNENRINDKVIVLERDNKGNITVKDKAEYFKCNSIEVVEDAFSIKVFDSNKSVVYLEGRTDEKYFNRALEVFGITVPFEFKWIGYIDENKNERNTGYKSLNNAFDFLIAQNLNNKNVCLYDSDTNKSEEEKNNIFIRCIPKYNNSKKMKKGVENALILDNIDTTSFYNTKIKEGDYGDDNIITEFDKMKFCDYICSLYKVAGYIRLSKEDKIKDESNSVTNQKAIIDSYVKKNEDLELIEFYIDDGYSGTTFDRPEYKRMIEDIVSGKVDTIIVKDLSRFGRNHIEADDYLENILPGYNVRFISTIDEIDSLKNPKSISSIAVPLKNLMNDQYARDISEKVRSTLKIKQLNGEFIGVTAPYGYLKDPKDKHKFIIDKESSYIVKKIFNMILLGKSRKEIAEHLNNKNVLTPSLYKLSKEKTNNEELTLSKKWNAEIVNRILRNETYTGILIQNIKTKPNYRTSKLIDVNKEEWIITENHHEPIIGKEKFYEVQQVL